MHHCQAQSGWVVGILAAVAVTSVVFAIPASAKPSAAAKIGVTHEVPHSTQVAEDQLGRTLYTWGLNSNGELGDRATNNMVYSPEAITLASDVTPIAISANDLNSLAIGSNKALRLGI